eukprot:scaffold656_cov403-Pavlova_lutheri.AAC.11
MGVPSSEVKQWQIQLRKLGYSTILLVVEVDGEKVFQVLSCSLQLEDGSSRSLVVFVCSMLLAKEGVILGLLFVKEVG